MNPLDTVTQFLRAALGNFLGYFLADFGRYLIAAAIVTALLAVLRRQYRQRRTVRVRTGVAERRGREFYNSIVSALVFGAVGWAVYVGATNGVFRIYDSVDRFGWRYWSASLILIVVAHDAYFYWTHRLLHTPRLFWLTHRTHHESVAPTQWAAYSFSVGEALVQGAFLPIYLLFVPTHVGVLFVWTTHQILRNAFGHCGVELEPRSWLEGWWGRWFTTTLHHDLHHAHGRHNYGLYFTWWDRWCGTEHPEYRARLWQLIDSLDRKFQPQPAKEA